MLEAAIAHAARHGLLLLEACITRAVTWSVTLCEGGDAQGEGVDERGAQHMAAVLQRMRGTAEQLTRACLLYGRHGARGLGAGELLERWAT